MSRNLQEKREREREREREGGMLLLREETVQITCVNTVPEGEKHRLYRYFSI